MSAPKGSYGGKEVHPINGKSMLSPKLTMELMRSEKMSLLPGEDKS